MRMRNLSKRGYLAILGIAVIILGGAGLLRAQRQAVRQVMQFGSGGPYLGIEMEDVTAESVASLKLSAESGVIVRSVEQGSPAEAAHLQANDVILEYAGMPVFSTAGLTRLVQETPVDRTVSLVVSRDGKKTSLSVKIGARKSGWSSGPVTVITPDTVLRKFEVVPPGSGTFRLQVPGREGRTFSFTMPYRPQLGVTVLALTDQMRTFLGVTGKGGILVTDVTPGSAASSALRAGDVILSIDGRSLAATNDLTQELARKTAGAKIEMKIVRDKKEMTVTVELPKSQTVQRGIKV